MIERDPLNVNSVVEDVGLPAQLLRATGNLGSLRDTRLSLAWEPQPALPEINEDRRRTLSQVPHRFSTAPTFSFQQNPVRAPGNAGESIRDDQQLTTAQPESDSTSPDTAQQEQKARKTSYNQGSEERLSVGHPASTNASSIWTTDDPFSSRRSAPDDEIRPGSRPGHSQLQSGTATAHDATENSCGQQQPRRGTLEAVVDALVPEAIQRRFTNSSFIRRSSIWQTYETAKKRGIELQRSKAFQLTFEYTIYVVIVLFVYFVLIGVPLWKGTVYWLWWVVAHKFVIAGGFAITLGIAFFYAFAPLLILFEKDPPMPESTAETKIQPNVQETALLIPCYKSARIIGATLEASLKIFPPSHIFVISNGNSPTPLDDTEEVCRPYGVNHIWSPIGSKIVAQFVGCYAAKAFKNVLLIDDDCALPENFPVVTERLEGNVQCIGYTIKSVGPNSSKGNLCQQAQDLEYKLSGIQREFAGKIGSATFPHGAIALWDRNLLVKTFHEHPGFSVSEDWFFGHVARQLGCRIKMCSHVFVETETPTAVFKSGGGSRGGFGEMTIFQQRFKRWNFFFVNGMWYNMHYIFGSWKLGWWELGAKIFVFQEVYETLLYLLTPFILPISFVVRPAFCAYLLAGTVVMYLVNVIIFNEIHLRRKNERLGWVLLYVYYLPYKIVLTGINVASCYWSLWKYARYFAKRHPKVVEDEKAVEVIVRLEEDAESKRSGLGRSMTVKTVGVTSQAEYEDPEAVSPMHLDLATCHITTPEQAHMGMPTPMRLQEGIAAVDYFTVASNTVASNIVARNDQTRQETSEATSEDILRVLGIFREKRTSMSKTIEQSQV
ncbi:hypothetical protein E8E13_001941 [Curvularia kusanoi]|uniref:Glycosyltransferase n=1 Tax=Curvularia kusanoi TaxID=90978 RepID=A0A9P4W5H4_CURKU|nr:hypothetical protein E8E13_001941 [Curvularia kusanoi]